MRWNKVISKWNSIFLFSVLFLIFFPQLLVSQNENIRFDHIGVNEGLSKSTVFCIFQDSKGFMWFGTQEGLNRYDGQSFIIYKDSNTKVENGAFGNVINDISEDRNGKIWIGTDKGLIKFDPTLEKFYGIADWQYDEDVRAICVDEKGRLWAEAGAKVIEVDPQNRICIGNPLEPKYEVNDICCVDNGELWIGTKNGLFRVGSEKKILGPYLKGQSISKIYEDLEKTLWVGTEDGKLFKYNDNKEFEPCYENGPRIGLNAICEDNENNLWLGLNGNGIVIYSKEKKIFEHIEKNFYVPGGLKDNFVQCIFKDNDGTMWIGTYNQGVNKFNPNKFKFTSYFNDPRDNNSLSGRSIFSIFEDNEGYIWIGTYDGELDRFDPREEKFESFDKGIFKGKSILSINEDRYGWLWIGTSEDLYRLDKKNGKNEKFEPIKDEVLGRNIRIIVKDQDNHHFWIGTGEKGIVKFDPKEEKFIDAFSEDNGLSDNNIYDAFSEDNGLSDNNIYYIFPDNKDDDILWVGTAKGLDKVNKLSGDVTPVIFKDKEIEVMHSFLPFIPEVNKERRIFSILPDSNKKDIFWLGTDSSGLCKFNKKSKEITSFTIRNGLPNNTVYGIFTDEQGYLWFSTNKGIVQFDPKEEKVKRTFDVNDGLQENEFNHGAHCKSHSGYMYFGGVRGLSVIHPLEIEKKIDENILPKIYFTKLRIGDRKVEVGDNEYFKDKILQKSITTIPGFELAPGFELDYKYQPFTLEFAALDYNVPDRIKYKYRLEKVGDWDSERWIPDNNNYYTFSNLNRGNYIFKVWSTNSDITHIDDITDKNLEHQTPAEIKFTIKKNLLDRLKPIIVPLILLFVIAFIVVLSFYIAFKTRTKRRIKQLRTIESAIADVSRQEHINGAIFKMLDYIVFTFGFEYGAISLINFLNSTIETSGAKTRRPDLIDKNRWNEGFKCKLNESNILTKVAKENKPIEDIDADLIRLFVPIEFRVKGKDIKRDEANIVFGVVEAGFHRSTRSHIPIEMKIILDLFLSYCSSLFYRALIISEKQIVENLLNKSSEIEEHKEYLERVLVNSVKLIGGDKGDISFFSFNENKIDVSNTPIFYNVDNEIDKKKFRRRFDADPKKGIIRHVAEMNHYYFSGNVKDDPYYIKEFEDVNSELAVPMRYSNRVIGVLNVYSTESGFFNVSKANIIQIIADEAAKIYQNKKIDFTVKNLVLPYHLFKGINEIYEHIIENIKDYFITEFVSVWEKSETTDIKYRLIIASSSLEKKYNTFGLYSLKHDIFGKISREVQLVNFESGNSFECGFDEFAKENEFESMILTPIIVDQQVYGFINIFSKRQLPPLFAEDKTFLNLIATKGAISAQYEKLISSFIEISNSLPSEDYDRILKNIVDSASRVLHADPVILFRYYKGQDIFGATISGSLFYPKLKDFINDQDMRKDHLALYIIKKGSVWFENFNDYQRYGETIGRQKKGKHFEDDFWTREKIKSSVGIRLEHNNEPIGVMFFNYRDNQRFDENTKRFIETFSSLASSAIVNAKYQHLIEGQNIELEKQSAQLQVQKEKLKFEYEEVHRKMTEMLPRATRTSFYLILEGINHDIRNFLIRLKQATIDIKENSERLHKKERYTITVRIKDIERNIRNVTNLLKLFNFRNPGNEAININELIEELTYFFKTRESESIFFDTTELKDGIPKIICNKAELSMIIYNLFSNSVNAIVEKMNLQGDIKGEIRISTDFKNDEYIIIVEDNGVGIERNDIPHIFEAGFTKKEKGMGIGLYFVDETLRENFWGTIGCESLHSHWTRFTIKIPESVNYKED